MCIYMSHYMVVLILSLLENNSRAEMSLQWHTLLLVLLLLPIFKHQLWVSPLQLYSKLFCKILVSPHKNFSKYLRDFSWSVFLVLKKIFWRVLRMYATLNMCLKLLYFYARIHKSLSMSWKTSGRAWELESLVTQACIRKHLM